MERIKYVWIFLILFLINGFAFADTYLEYKSFPKGKVLVYLTPKYMRMDVEEYGGIEVPPVTLIYNKFPRKIFILNHKEKSYVEINEELLKKIEEAKKEMEEQLSNLPPVAREMAKQMFMPGCEKLKEIPDEPCEEPKIIGEEIFKNLPAKIVDGCKHFDVEKNSFVICRFWFVDGKKLNIDPKDFETLSSFLDFEWEFVKVMGSFCGTEASSIFLARPQRILKLDYELPIPVKASAVSEGIEETQIILENVSTNALKEDLFTLPKNYKKIDIKVPEFKKRR